MESLEIIKRKINEIYGFDGKWEEVRELEQIEQDLEVLEIIRKKKVDVNDVYICDRYELYIIYMKNLEIAEESILTLEEFNKVKQWLEENENE